ncbi:hypothetical protein [Paraglaciecola sp. 2405UD69-4]|uniref:hypothetical protein n=1 Tax=Paraglaciecola sp. 2405UD69-4 TaxID=3391836 RepID=UPI0039C8DBD5
MNNTILDFEIDLESDYEKKFYRDLEAILLNLHNSIFNLYNIKDVNICFNFSWLETANASCKLSNDGVYNIQINRGIVNLGLSIIDEYYDVEHPIRVGDTVFSFETIAIIFVCFIYGHELFHALAGHLKYIKDKRSNGVEPEFEPLEYDADNLSVMAVYYFAKQRFGSVLDEYQLKELILIGLFWPIRLLTENNEYIGSLDKNTHPDLHVRLYTCIQKVCHLECSSNIDQIDKVKLKENIDKLFNPIIDLELRYLKHHEIDYSDSSLLKYFKMIALKQNGHNVLIEDEILELDARLILLRIELKPFSHLTII